MTNKYIYVVQSFIVAFGIIVLNVGCSNSTNRSDEESSQSQSYSSTDESNNKLQNSTSRNSEIKTEEIAESSSSSIQKEREEYPLEKYIFTDASGLKYTLILNPDETAILKCDSRNIIHYGYYDPKCGSIKGGRRLSFVSDEPEELTFPNGSGYILGYVLTSDNFIYDSPSAAMAKNPKARFEVKKVK